MKVLIIICIAVALIIQIGGAGMTGGWSPVADVNSTDFQKMVSFANERISAGSNFAYLMKPIEVVNAFKQIVAGANYKFTMRVQATSCKKHNSENVDLKECETLPCGAVDKCKVVVWDKPWEENRYKLTKEECKREPKSC